MRTPGAILAVLFASVGWCAGTPQSREPIKPELGGVALGDIRGAVEKRLGKPRRVTSTGDALTPELRFPGITVWLWKGGGVAQIRSTSPRYCARSPVCPGASASAAATALGPPQEGPRIREGVNSYTVAAEACWLEVLVGKAVVTSLELKCQP